jgi:hypothetical protein
MTIELSLRRRYLHPEDILGAEGRPAGLPVGHRIRTGDHELGAAEELAERRLDDDDAGAAGDLRAAGRRGRIVEVAAETQPGR